MTGFRSLAMVVPSLALVATTVASPTYAAWSPKMQVAMAEHALKVVPPDLERQIQRHKRRFREGILAADESQRESSRSGAGSQAVDLSTVIGQQADKTVRLITDHRPFSDIVFQLGVVAHFVAMANEPIPTGNPDQPRLDFKDDYLHYLDTASPRFAVLYYGYGRQIEAPDQLHELIQRSLRRNRILAPMIAREYQRIGSLDGSTLFDDRSTAFGVGALTFCHGVSDITAVLRYIWLRAGGVDIRHLPTLDENHLILVGRGAESPATGDETP